jgi:hypothetical protein
MSSGSNKTSKMSSGSDKTFTMWTGSNKTTTSKMLSGSNKRHDRCWLYPPLVQAVREIFVQMKKWKPLLLKTSKENVNEMKFKQQQPLAFL